ncbi:hypothetical protein LguiA_023654 [Lonicera macranthoides]
MKKAKPYIGVIFLQFGYAAMAIIAKSALDQGMSTFTFSVYRNLIAFVIFTPFALHFERPVIDQNLYYSGMKYTSATFSSAMCNVLPAITFFMAWIFRLEKVNMKTLHGQGKIVGTLVTVGGAMIMTLIKGPTIRLPWTTAHNNPMSPHIQSTSVASHQQHHIMGSLMITAGCFCWACFVILQAITLKSYPAELSLTALICMMGAVQGTLVTFLFEKGNTSIWVVGAIVIVVGLYLVIWGKSKDQNASDYSDKDKEVLPVDQPHQQQMTPTSNSSMTSKHDDDDDACQCKQAIVPVA